MANQETLDKFGQILMTRVRDKAIIDWDRMINGELKGRTAEKVRQELEKLTPEALNALQQAIPRIVDTTLHHALWTIEQEESIELAIKLDEDNFEGLRELSDGLAGELYGQNGWIARFSEERNEEI